MSIAVTEDQNEGHEHSTQQNLNDMARVLLCKRWQVPSSEADQLLTAEDSEERVTMLLSIHS